MELKERAVEKKKLVVQAILVALVVVLAYQIMVARRALVELQVVTETRTLLRVYYKAEGEQWTEKRVASQLIRPGIERYAFRLADLADIEELRIDTSEKPAVVKVKSLTISQIGFSPFRIDRDEDFVKLQPIAGIATATIDQGLTVTPSSNDPQLLLVLPKNLKNDFSLKDWGTPIALFVLTFALFIAAYPLFPDYHFSIAFCLAVLSLIVVMAAISSPDQHPDEGVHIQAAQYYIDHWLPPAVGDPEILNSYSTYGVSRLHSGEIAYFFAGKFASLLAPFHIPPYLAFRFFNIGLFTSLVIFGIRSLNMRILMVPLLLSPQIWYVFSYFNSEAFAVLLILAAAYQVVVPGSAWNRVLEHEKEKVTLPILCGLGGLAGLLLLIKANFYFYVLFIGCYILWRFLFGEIKPTRSVFVRLASIGLIGLSLFATVRGIDSYINDFHKKEKILEARELYAGPLFKPSTPLAKKFINLQMKDRGVGLDDMISHGRWGEKIFRSSVGEYGYMTVAASLGHYDLVRYSSLLLLVVSILFVAVKGGVAERTLTVAAVGCALLLGGASLYHAWAIDFQAQGRYFLPVIGMLSICFYRFRDHLRNLPCGILYIFVFGLSLYSFVFVGLAGIGKISQPFG